MLEIGRLCVKTAGRDAMENCVVIKIIDKNTVLIDGNTRRKNVSILHIEPLNKVLEIKEGAETKEVLAAFEKEGIEVKKLAEKKDRSEKKAQVKKDKKGSLKSEKKKVADKKAKK